MTTETMIETPVTTPIGGFQDYKLPPFLLEGLRRLNFQQPTPIQEQSIPVLMNGQDLIAQSQTGSGKTAAFAIPLISRVQRQSPDLQALVMVPTRELALQVTQVFKSLAGPAIRITTIYGGAGMDGQIRGLNRGGYQIVVGTPGRLRDHLNRGTLKLSKLRMLVLDEADEMLDQGFAQDVEAIISAAPPAAQRQTALFSATLPNWVNQTAKKHLRPDRVEVTLESDNQSKPDIKHLVYDMSLSDKAPALRHLLDTNTTQPMLVFARTKHGVKKLAARLEDEGYSVAGLQGNLSQNAREAVMSAFRTNRVRILVATNVGARGLDVSGVSHVINYDLPESAELFTHRVGRTGRNGASGVAITFLTGEDRVKWREIDRALNERGTQIERLRWDGPKAEPGSQTRDNSTDFQTRQGQAGRPDDNRTPRYQDRERAIRTEERFSPRGPEGQGQSYSNERPPRRQFDQDRRGPFQSDQDRRQPYRSNDNGFPPRADDRNAEPPRRKPAYNGNSRRPDEAFQPAYGRPASEGASGNFRSRPDDRSRARRSSSDSRPGKFRYEN